MNFPFDVIAILCAVCGLIMVCGGIYLMYKGILKFPKTTPGEALSIETKNAMRDFKFSTTTPALAFFIIGLLFIIIPLVAAKPSSVQTIRISGQLQDVKGDESVVFKVYSPHALMIDSSGTVMGSVTPSLNDFYLEVTAPGVKEYTKNIERSCVRNGELSLGSIALIRMVKRDGISTQINPTANNVILPPKDAQQMFSFQGVVLQASTNIPIPGLIVSLVHPMLGRSVPVMTNQFGQFVFFNIPVVMDASIANASLPSARGRARPCGA